MLKYFDDFSQINVLVDSYDRVLKQHLFYENMSKGEGIKKIDINGLINQIAEESGADDEVKEEAISRIQEARIKLSIGEE